MKAAVLLAVFAIKGSYHHLAGRVPTQNNWSPKLLEPLAHFILKGPKCLQR